MSFRIHVPILPRGLELITAERHRQIDQEGWTIKHDSQHEDGELALAAICYATPSPIYLAHQSARMITYQDPWPWEAKWDKRLEYGERRSNPGNVPANPKTYSDDERIDLLVKAGALIAAEIDRLQIRKELGQDK